MWVFSVNYHVFLALIFLTCSFSKKDTFFGTLEQIGLLCTAVYDVIPIWRGNRLCVAPRVGYYAFFLQQIERPRNTMIRFQLFYQSRAHAELASGYLRQITCFFECEASHSVSKYSQKVYFSESKCEASQ